MCIHGRLGRPSHRSRSRRERARPGQQREGSSSGCVHTGGESQPQWRLLVRRTRDSRRRAHRTQSAAEAHWTTLEPGRHTSDSKGDTHSPTMGMEALAEAAAVARRMHSYPIDGQWRAEEEPPASEKVLINNKIFISYDSLGVNSDEPPPTLVIRVEVSVFETFEKSRCSRAHSQKGRPPRPDEHAWSCAVCVSGRLRPCCCVSPSAGWRVVLWRVALRDSQWTKSSLSAPLLGRRAAHRHRPHPTPALTPGIACPARTPSSIDGRLLCPPLPLLSS